MTEKEIARFRRVEAIFNGALDHPAGAERDAFLRAQTSEDASLLDEVRQLIEDHERVLAAAPQPPEPLPHFGPWQAIRLLGRGGMGTVYLAERSDGAFRMAVAVKVVPLALASVDIEERFRRERQFLASLDHPKIARLLDGGVTAAGLPYLVMEFVDGLAIDRYCDAHHLDTRSRMNLVRQVLEALIYVHSRQVIHRDLKPSNILVDAAGNAKLLDFGTARLADASGDNAITKTGIFAFTPECASPEQVQGKTLTFASDVYSAGVLLYRLLTNRLPYQFADFSPPVVTSTITEVDPAPSGLDPPLDAILSTALRKNPEERYPSAAEMDADLARYLEGQPVRARKPRKVGPIAAMIPGIIISAVALWAVFHRGIENAQPSIAVLPFVNLNSEPDSRYLAGGLTDGITDGLSQWKTLKVIAPASAAELAGKKASLRDAGRLLHVNAVLEGSVARSGDRVRVVARLERVPDGAVLWSETYDRPQPELLAVQSEVTAAVARTLKVAVSSARPRHIPTPAAHDYAMKARYEAQQLTADQLAQAVKDYQHAIDLDPQYAMAYLGLGMTRYDQTAARGPSYQTDDERREAIGLTRRALELDPGLASARAWLAVMAMQYDWDWDQALQELKLASAETPNSMAEQGYAFWLIFHGRFAEADEHIRRMQDLDPFSTPSISNLALMRNLEGRYEESREAALKLSALYPKMILPRVLIGATYLQENRTDLAFEEIRKSKDLQPREIYEALAYARSGQREEALRRLRPLEEKGPNPAVATQWFALAYAYMGDEPQTLKWLERSADRREWQALNLAVHPAYAFMRNSPRFRALEKRMGLLP